MYGAGADKDQPKTRRGTPMYTAAPAGNEAVVQLLCNAGAYTVLLTMDGAPDGWAATVQHWHQHRPSHH